VSGKGLVVGWLVVGGGFVGVVVLLGCWLSLWCFLVVVVIVFT